MEIVEEIANCLAEVEIHFVDKRIYKCISLVQSVILEANGFDWDRGNRAKCEKHGLSADVIESLFARPLAILPDAAHSQRERRLRAIGRTDKGRGVFIIFTLRRKGDELLIRPISARYMHKKEIEAYEKENPDL